MPGRQLTSAEYARLAGSGALIEAEWAPCRSACPVHADVRAYLDLIGRGKFREALDVIREVLPFPGACGRICHHPCEQDCRRNDVDQPAAIRDLKRFVTERDYPEGQKFRKPVQDRAPVAVVGAGPSGLTAALDLAKLGYRPTVFDRSAAGGGLLYSAVPAYRLPRKVLQADVDAILAQGVELKLGVEVGGALTIDALRSQGFKAVVIAVGLSRSRGLPIPGADAQGVELALPFLASADSSGPRFAGKSVVVVGGGNVAVDVARTAIRLGAVRVQMACLENEKEQPAWAWERHEAAEEEVATLHRLGPKRIVVRDGRVAGIEFKAVTAVFDEQGRFSPKYDESKLTTLDCDVVIFAIGQESDLSLARGTDVKVDERGRLVFDRNTARTSAQDVFACGEVVTGPGSAVEAVASGHRAARAVHQFLTGAPINLAESLPPKVEKIAPATVNRLLKATRAAMPTVGAAERRRNFAEFELGLDEAAAMQEARRCMSCASGPFVLTDKCAACLTCRRVCPFEIPEVKEIADISSALCQGCGICASECPANAIVMASYGPDAVQKEVGAALAVLRPDRLRIVVFSCGHHAPATRWGGSEAARPAAVAKEIYLPSMSRLSAADILAAFEAGADGVAILECTSGACRYPTVDQRLRRRVDLARQLLVEAGIDGARLSLAVGGAGDPAAASKAVAQVAERAARQTHKHG
ncbi:MAG TPA: FAD-dependent oxidoreductase [Planctomycetota bacterium]|nr:FAD-dependent oxidoreductase [Planctomycetota bacterium]